MRHFFKAFSKVSPWPLPWLLTTFGCLIAGASSALAFAPYNLPLLPLLGVGLLFFCFSRAQSPWQGLGYGLAFGLGLFGVGASWIFYSIQQFGESTAAFAGLLTGLFVLIFATTSGLAGFLATFWRLPTSGAAAMPWRGFQLLLLFPAAWVLGEYSRHWLFFPWLHLGDSQLDTLLQGYAPIFGSYGISFLLAQAAGALVFFFLCRRLFSRFLIILSLILLWSLGGFLSQVEWSRPTGQKLAVSLLQGNIEQWRQGEPGHLDAALARYLRLSERQWGRALIVWPETAIPAFVSDMGEELLRLQQAALANGSSMVLGIFADDDAGRFYNSALLLGAEPALYHKQRLVPFGEYIPWRPLLAPLARWVSIPEGDLAPAPRQNSVFLIQEQSMSIGICYEVAFADHWRAPESAFLINISNDGWFGTTAAPEQHLQLARMRALENSRYLLRATNSGITAIIDHKGNIINSLTPFTVGILQGEVIAQRGKTPFNHWGDAPLFGVFLLIFLLAFFGHFSYGQHLSTASA